MYAVKLPYYPSVVSMANETRFGVLEITTPTIYEKPIEGMKIVRVDALECLRDVLGETLVSSRSSLYKLISGNCGVEDYRELLAEYYKKYPEVTNFINEVYDYGNNDIPIDKQVASRLLDLVNNNCRDVITSLTSLGGKYLITTHLYMYFKFAEVADTPDLKGVKVIC